MYIFVTTVPFRSIYVVICGLECFPGALALFESSKDRRPVASREISPEIHFVIVMVEDEGPERRR